MHGHILYGVINCEYQVIGFGWIFLHKIADKGLKALKEVRMLNAHIHEILKVFDI